MAIKNILYKKEIVINDDLSVRIPTVGEILECDEEYYQNVNLLTAMPIDLMVYLDDVGVDFTEINEYELFLLLFYLMKDGDMSMIFGDLDLSSFDIVTNNENGMVVLRNDKTGVVIDRAIHEKIASALRKIHHLKKDIRKPGNTEAKKWMIERERKKLLRRKNKEDDSQLEQLIVALVNTEQFSYKYDEVLDLTIYQFNESVSQIINKIDYDNKMRGVYAGTISVKDLSQKDFNWLSHK